MGKASQRSALRALVILLAISILSASYCRAATLYWDGTGTSWNLASSWSIASNAITPDPAQSPGAADVANFNISTLNAAQTVNLDAPQASLGLIFNSTGTVLIQSTSGGGAANSLTIGANGITHGAGAGADTISAPVILSAPQLWVNNSSGIFTASGGVNLQANALTIDGAATTTIGYTVSGAGGLIKNGSAALRLNASNTFTGGLTIHAGPVILSNAGALNSATPNAISFDAGSIGALTLNGNSVTVSALTTNATVGSPFVENKSATPATLTVNNSINDTFAGVLQDSAGGGTLSLTKAGTGALTLSGANLHTGATLINAGTLVLGNASALGSAPGTTTVASGATLDLGGQVVASEPLTLSGTGVGNNGALVNNSANDASLAGSVTLNAPTYLAGSGNITLGGSVIDPGGTGLLTKLGNNTLTLSGTSDNTNLHVAVNSGTLVLAKTNDAHNALAIGFGGLSVNGGTAQLAGTGSDQIWDLTDVTVTSGTFDTNGRNETLRTLYLQGSGISGTGALVNNASSTITTLTPTNGTVLTSNATIAPTTNAVITLNNTISGNFALTKSGGGTLYLTGNNTFSGGLNIRSGDLQVLSVNNANTSGPLGINSSVTLGANGTTGRLTYTGLTSASTNMPFVLDTGGSGAFSMVSDTSLTLNGPISGAGTLNASYGPLVLGASNTFTGGVTIGSSAMLQLANAGALNAASPNSVNMLGGTLSLNGNSITVTGLSSSSSAAIVQNGGAAAATLTVENSTNNTFAGVLGFSVNNLLLRKISTGSLTLSGSADNVGVAVAASGGTLILAKTSSTSPDVHAVGGGGLTVSGGTAQLAGTGGDQIYNFAPVTINSGTLDMNGRNETVYQLSMQGTGIASTGALVNAAAAASTLTTINGTTLTGNATIGLSQSSGTLALNSGINGNFAITKVGAGTLRLSGSSTFSGGFNLNQGKLLVKSPGAIGTGPLTIASTATLGIEIDGSANPPFCDHINVVGQLSLSGTLAVSVVGSFTPAAGNSFDILDWGTLTGTFTSIQLPALPSSLEWNTSQLYSTGVLSVATAALPGDFDHNGIVNAADYIVWRKGLGTTYTQSEYDTWRSHFGQIAGSGSGTSVNAAVPEPAILVLVMFAVAGLFLRRQRKA